MKQIAINSFIIARKEYAEDLNLIDQFERKYSSNDALTWYTRDCFLYRLLNKPLRLENVDAFVFILIFH